MTKPNPYTQAAKYSAIIFLLPSCLLVGYWVGDYLDGRLGTPPAFTIAFILLGAAAGFLQVFRLLR